MNSASSSTTIAIATDHAGVALKAALLEHLQAHGHQAIDCGTDSSASVDYPDFSAKVTGAILSKKADVGVLICGSGIGMSIAANRNVGIRAALCHSSEMAQLARAHNNANVVVLGARFTDIAQAKEILTTFLNAEFEGGRHAQRVAKLDSASSC